MKHVLTSRGAATKRRIVEAAAELIYAKGAGRVSLDEVMEASGASKSQIYHYFCSKDDLVREVIEFQTGRILQTNVPHLERLDSFEALRVWRDAVVAANRAGGGVGGCPLGSLASELASQSEDARHLLDQSFAAWNAVIETGLSRMKASGSIKPALRRIPSPWPYWLRSKAAFSCQKRRAVRNRWNWPLIWRLATLSDTPSNR